MNLAEINELIDSLTDKDLIAFYEAKREQLKKEITKNINKAI